MVGAEPVGAKANAMPAVAGREAAASVRGGSAAASAGGGRAAARLVVLARANASGVAAGAVESVVVPVTGSVRVVQAVVQAVVV